MVRNTIIGIVIGIVIGVVVGATVVAPRLKPAESLSAASPLLPETKNCPENVHDREVNGVLRAS